jgi:muramoyltetrapeptide carboxypeptidase
VSASTVVPRSFAPPLRKPPALRPGDRVAVVAPASPFDRALFDRGLVELAELGFEPVFDDSVFARHAYLAGPAAERAAALDRAWRDPSIAGIIAVRGGYGSVHLLPLLDPEVARRAPKVLLGYSDITSLHVWLTQHAGIVAFQAPMIEGRLARGPEAYDRAALLRTITSAAPAGELDAPGLETLRPGEASGPLYGGTLTQLAASLGTPWAFDPPPGHVLLLEDVGERPYRLDRLVTQLRFAGVLARAAAIVLGTFPRCDEPDGSTSARAVLEELFARFPGPVVVGCPVGHVDGASGTLPLGVTVRVVASTRPRVVVEEAAVA